jgi:hypothetical protein
MKSDPYAMPPVYDPDELKTFEEYQAQAVLMGFVFDWRDGTFCADDGTGRPHMWAVDGETSPPVSLPDDFGDFAFAFDCVTGVVIGATLASERRDYFKTFRGGKWPTSTGLPWLRVTD